MGINRLYICQYKIYLPKYIKKRVLFQKYINKILIIVLMNETKNTGCSSCQMEKINGK